MIINEKGILKQMKEAARGKGYEVGIREVGEGAEFITIHGQGWSVDTTREFMPRSVLALIVQHCGFIPEAGTVYKVTKHMGAESEIPAEFWAASLEATAACEGWMENRDLETKFSGLTYNDETALLVNRAGKMIPVKVDHLSIASAMTRMQSDGNLLVFNGAVSMVFVSRQAMDANRLDYLERIGKAIKLQWDTEESGE